MTVRLDFWGREIPNEPPAPPTKKKYRKPVQQQYGRESIDIEAWLRSNRPANEADLKNLRTALYERRNCGRYTVQSAGDSSRGEQRFRLTGPESVVLIVSEKARHFLLRKLCRLHAFVDA